MMYLSRYKMDTEQYKILETHWPIDEKPSKITPKRRNSEYEKKINKFVLKI